MTGYTGKERTLLKNMIFIVGARYTGYLTRTNTHIICKRYNHCLSLHNDMGNRVKMAYALLYKDKDVNDLPLYNSLCVLDIKKK